MNIFLKHLEMVNFKGCKALTIDFNSNTHISGANATGKTTIIDAYMWLLFNKDSAGNTTFGIRPVDSDGKDIDNIEISVCGTFDVDGKELTLKKVQKQKWTKRRGSTAPTYEGNVNSYEIDGFPVSEKEYKLKISEILSEDNFKLVSDLRYFSNLRWEEKRNLLLQLCGDVTDEDVLDADPEHWAAIRNDVMTAGTDRAKDKVKKELRELNKEQREYPVRIDELSRQIQDDIPTLSIEDELKQVTEEANSIPVKVTANMDADTKRIEWLRSEIDRIVTESRATSDAAHEEYRKKIREIDIVTHDLSEANRAIADMKHRSGIITNDMNDYATMHKKLKGSAFDEKLTHCGTCGQILPAGKVKEMRSPS